MMGFFPDKVLGWLQTVILLVSASRVARITVVNHWHPASPFHHTIFLFHLLGCPEVGVIEYVI
jgi:hypothetical protein